MDRANGYSKALDTVANCAIIYLWLRETGRKIMVYTLTNNTQVLDIVEEVSRQQFSGLSVKLSDSAQNIAIRAATDLVIRRTADAIGLRTRTDNRVWMLRKKLDYKGKWQDVTLQDRNKIRQLVLTKFKEIAASKGI
jgi:hypothetical protein